MYACKKYKDVRWGQHGHTLLLENPLNNTLTYITVFGLLCKQYQMYTPIVPVVLGIGSLVKGVNLGFGSLRTQEGHFGPLDGCTLG